MSDCLPKRKITCILGLDEMTAPPQQLPIVEALKQGGCVFDFAVGELPVGASTPTLKVELMRGCVHTPFFTTTGPGFYSLLLPSGGVQWRLRIPAQDTRWKDGYYTARVTVNGVQHTRILYRHCNHCFDPQPYDFGVTVSA